MANEPLFTARGGLTNLGAQTFSGGQFATVGALGAALAGGGAPGRAWVVDDDGNSVPLFCESVAANRADASK